jgi:chorismate-pyruvate lyase
MNIDSLSKLDTLVNTRVKELFIAQTDRPAALNDTSLTRLTPFHRALLVADGTVTRFIEAYKLSPVQVVLLYQARRTLHNNHSWLELPTGGNIIAREVVLQTPSTENQTPKIHAYAVSQIVYERLPPNVVEGLEAGINGLGVLLQNSRLETRRDLLWWGVERATGLPSSIAHFEGKPFLSRTYRIVANGNPLMLITEKFPLDDS